MFILKTNCSMLLIFVTSIASAFDKCISLAHVDIPSSATVILYRSFNQWKSLTEVVIPSVRKIGYDAFTECISLENVEIDFNKY